MLNFTVKDSDMEQEKEVIPDCDEEGNYYISVLRCLVSNTYKILPGCYIASKVLRCNMYFVSLKVVHPHCKKHWITQNMT